MASPQNDGVRQVNEVAVIRTVFPKHTSKMLATCMGIPIGTAREWVDGAVAATAAADAAGPAGAQAGAVERPVMRREVKRAGVAAMTSLAHDGAAVTQPIVEVREREVSADWIQEFKCGKFRAVRPETMLTYFYVFVDGRRVDSFLTRARAEADAAKRREVKW